MCMRGGSVWIFQTFRGASDFASLLGEASDKRLLPIVKLNFYFCRLDVTHRVSAPKIPEKQAARRRPKHPSKLAVKASQKAVAVLPRQRRRGGGKNAAIRTSKLKMILRFEGAGLWEMFNTAGDKMAECSPPAY